MNSNITSSTTSILHELFLNQDLELINLCQSGIGLICSLIIMFKLFDIGSFFKTVRDKRNKMRKESQKKEYERMKKLFESIQNKEELQLTSDDEDDDDGDTSRGVMKIAHRKKKQNESIV